MTDEVNDIYAFPAGLTVQVETRQQALARAEETVAGRFVRLSRARKLMTLVAVPEGWMPAECIRLG